ncbi:MAG: 5-formyltetrahydrofolate cyclo-ligase [Deltaproteobacteria bacterium]|nr:5-formyltetrahydrofolate cyclo-ligase [Deltaproteobacteria bacterium]
MSVEGQGSPAKQAIREAAWRRLEQAKAARFPGAQGRIPNFVGAEAAARRLQTLAAWQQATVLKVNPDAPQLPVRKAALEQGKVVYMAVPRLREQACFLELDPKHLRVKPHQAASIQGAFAHGRQVTLEEVRPVDMVVCGSVAVTREGARVGKGGGFSDLEFALLSERGRIGPGTPVITTVHPLQITEEPIEMRVHDIPLDAIVTPDETIVIERGYARPQGIYWELLEAEKIAEVPVLQALRPAGRRRERR